MTSNSNQGWNGASAGGKWPAPDSRDLIMDFSNGKDPSLLENNAEVRLATQKLRHRKILFWTCVLICGGLYLLFALLVLRAWWSAEFFQILLIHKHIGAFILALLIVPSALLWGLLRAAYMSENIKNETDNAVKTVANLHPGSEV